jgi:hypothetical protein
VFAGLGSRDSHLAVELVRSRDNDGIHSRIGQKRLPITVGPAPVLGREGLGQRLCLRADSHELHLGQRRKRTRMHGPEVSGAKNSDAQHANDPFPLSVIPEFRLSEISGTQDHEGQSETETPESRFSA